MKSWASSLLSSNKILSVPIMTHPGIELIGKRVIDAVTKGDVHAQSIMAINEAYNPDALTVIMDLTVEAEAFGAQVVFEDNDVPNVVGRLLTSAADVEALQIPDMSAGRLAEYIKANKIVSEEVTDKPLFGGAIGPFSLAGRLYDMTEIMMAIYCEPDTAKLLLRKCTDFLKLYIAEIKKAGSAGVVIAEPAAGLLSDEDATAYSSIYVKEIIDLLQDDNFMIVLHNCGNTGHCTPSMVATGAASLHFGNKIDMVAALKESPAECIVMGNLDPVSIFKQASAAEVVAATESLLAECAEFPNFVISTGCDTPPNIPEENIKAFYETMSKHNLKL